MKKRLFSSNVELHTSKFKSQRSKDSLYSGNQKKGEGKGKNSRSKLLKINKKKVTSTSYSQLNLRNLKKLTFKDANRKESSVIRKSKLNRKF